MQDKSDKYILWKKENITKYEEAKNSSSIGHSQNKNV